MTFHFRNDHLGDGLLMRQVSFVQGHFPCQMLHHGPGLGISMGKDLFLWLQDWECLPDRKRSIGEDRMDQPRAGLSEV